MNIFCITDSLFLMGGSYYKFWIAYILFLVIVIMGRYLTFLYFFLQVLNTSFWQFVIQNNQNMPHIFATGPRVR